MPALRFQLEKAIVITHYPVVTDGAFTLEPEDAIQFRDARRTTVIILWSGSRPRETLVVFWQILPLQINVGCFVTVDPSPSQFFHQAVLMRAVLTFHTSLGLR